MSTNNKWLIGIGVILLLAVMYALPFVFQSVAPGGYGMMGGGGMMRNGGGMAGGGYNAMHNMMHGGMMMGGYGFTWLVLLALLTLLGLSIAALIKYLRSA